MSKDDTLILSITRTIDAPRDVVWRCWTQAELLKQWYCPRPWTVPEADMDLRAGGRMNVTMAGPDGERIALQGCFLDVKPQERLVFTDAYHEDFMPQPESFMTGVVELSDGDAGGTTMVWSARHSTEQARQQHLDMGFETGWNTAADQLNELARSLAREKP